MFNRIGKNKARTEAQQNEILWQMIHAPDEFARADSGANVSDELRELADISQTLRENYDDPAEKARLEMNAQSSFAPIHSRLMKAIESDVAARRSTPKPQHQRWIRVLDWLIPRNAALRFATLTAILTATALGSHTVGYYRATQHSATKSIATSGFLTQKSDSMRVLPVQSLVNDFDETLHRNAPFEFVFDTQETTQNAAKRLKNQLGVAMHLPMQPRLGAKLLGARRHFGWSRAGVQAHYVKDGVRVAVYQMREPACALGDLQEVEWNGHLFMTGTRGAYRVVVWRAGEYVMTMVSLLAMRSHDSLLLAAAFREPDRLA